MNSPIELLPHDDRRPSAARSQFYKILSGVFAYPADEAQAHFVRHGARQALRDAAADLPFAVPAVAALVAQDDAADPAATYTRLFDNCSGRPALSLHEKDYVRQDTKQIWEDLIRFYEHFGLAYEHQAGKEWPDHVGTELEFLHYLTFLESGAPDPQIYAAAAADFLERHLAKWAGKFAEKVNGMADDSPYGPLAQVLAEFIAGDTEFCRQRRALQ